MMGSLHRGRRFYSHTGVGQYGQTAPSACGTPWTRRMHPSPVMTGALLRTHKGGSLPSPQPYPASCIPRVRVFRRQVPGTGFQVPGTRHPGPDQRRGPDTEPRRLSPATGKRAHRVCILHPCSSALLRFEMWEWCQVPGKRNPSHFYPASCILHPCSRFSSRPQGLNINVPVAFIKFHGPS
jgi:hypothetical protein